MQREHLMYRLLIVAIIFVAINAPATGQLAQRPPMGWNSYNCFGSAVHEDEVKANADYMAKNLKQYGWEYVVVDFLWSYDNPKGSRIGNAYQRRLEDGSFVPFLTMDEWGRLVPHVHKFPSTFGGKGFKPLSDYVHSLGLKFGIHVMRGIPRQAVWLKTPVKGAPGITADMIADTSSACPWLNHMYGINMSKKGAQEYLNSLLDLYSEWDTDFIKVDDIARPYHAAEVEGYHKAIQQTGKSIVLSISPGETPVAQAKHVQEYTQMWRMADDFWDNWEMIMHMFQYAKNWEGTGGPGHWPDCDMIQIGKLSKRGPVGPERYSRFTEDELYTHMTFWSIYRSPLMLGGNLPENRELELKLFTNDEVLAVNQNGENPRQLYKTEGSLAWVSNVQGSKDIYVALFNTGNAAQEVSIDLSAIGFRKKVAIRDLWQKKDLGQFKKQYKQMINAHGTLLIRVTPL